PECDGAHAIALCACLSDSFVKQPRGRTTAFPQRACARVSARRSVLDGGGRRECRVLAAPIASRGNEENHTSFSHYRYAETFRHSLRDGFTVSSALSSETRRCCLRRLRIASQA